jgi:hypothetical protein
MLDKKMWNKILLTITIINICICITTVICFNIYQNNKSERFKLFVDSDLFTFYSKHHLNIYNE